MPDSEAVTQGIRIRVESGYVPERSKPEESRWLFPYTVKITNESSVTVQLISRHWVITDANGKVENVRGPGVVGRQPVLGPGTSFEYSSACPLRTSFGTMHGTYQMVTAENETFDAEIAPFSLALPFGVN